MMQDRFKRWNSIRPSQMPMNHEEWRRWSQRKKGILVIIHLRHNTWVCIFLEKNEKMSVTEELNEQKIISRQFTEIELNVYLNSETTARWIEIPWNLGQKRSKDLFYAHRHIRRVSVNCKLNKLKLCRKLKVGPSYATKRASPVLLILTTVVSST